MMTPWTDYFDVLYNKAIHFTISPASFIVNLQS